RDTSTTQRHTLSLHDALPIFTAARQTLDSASAQADSDPLSAFHAAISADAELDRATAAATDRKLAAEDLRRRFEHALIEAPAQIDRKSTRLNSSHVKISYAVF